MPKTIKIKSVTFKAPKQKKYDTKQLKKGKKVESEHTDNKKVQDVIVKNHLDEDKNYYGKSKPRKKK